MVVSRWIGRSLLFPSLLLFASPATADVSLLVTNAATDQVLRYDATTGAYLGIFAQDTGTVAGLTYGADNNLYVTNLDTQTVQQFNGATGAFLSTFIGPSGGLIFPHDITTGPDGNLYVASGETDSVREYSGTTGAFITTFASGNGLSRPGGLIFHDGNLYVASSATNQILEFSGTTGAFITTFASGNGLSGPAQLAFNAAGDLFVANFLASNVLEFGPDGSLLRVISGNGLGEVAGVAIGPDGNLYAASATTNSILEFNGTTGAFIRDFASGGPLDEPQHLIFSATPVPEPSGLALIAAGGAGLLMSRVRNRRPVV